MNDESHEHFGKDAPQQGLLRIWWRGRRLLALPVVAGRREMNGALAVMHSLQALSVVSALVSTLWVLRTP
jgi:hypothetical protein